MADILRMNSTNTVRVDVILTNDFVLTYSVIVDEFSAAKYDPVDYVRRMLFSCGIFGATVMPGS